MKVMPNVHTLGKVWSTAISKTHVVTASSLQWQAWMKDLLVSRNLRKIDMDNTYIDTKRSLKLSSTLFSWTKMSNLSTSSLSTWKKIKKNLWAYFKENWIHVMKFPIKSSWKFQFFSNAEVQSVRHNYRFPCVPPACMHMKALADKCPWWQSYGSALPCSSPWHEHLIIRMRYFSTQSFYCPQSNLHNSCTSRRATPLCHAFE